MNTLFLLMAQWQTVPVASDELDGYFPVVPEPPSIVPVEVPVPEGETRDDYANRRDIRREATSTRHLLTHYPYNRCCDACAYGKLQEKSHFKGAFST